VPVLELEIDHSGTLSADLVTQVNECCDRAEDARGEATLRMLLASADDNRSAWPGDVDIKLLNRWERALRRLERVPAVVVAVADGRCRGPAIELLLVADLRIAGPDLRVTLPADDGQVWPGALLYRLANRVGPSWVRRLCLLADEVSADVAVQCGLVDEVAEQPWQRSEAIVEHLRDVSGTEWAIRRTLLLEAVTTCFEEALGAHLAASNRTLRRAEGLVRTSR
jgi:isomerase DpgB